MLVYVPGMINLLNLFWHHNQTHVKSLHTWINKMHPPQPPLTTSVDSDVLSSEPMPGRTAGNQQSNTNDIQPNQVYLGCGCHFFRLRLNSTNLYRYSLSLEEKMANFGDCGTSHHFHHSVIEKCGLCT